MTRRLVLLTIVLAVSLVIGAQNVPIRIVSHTPVLFKKEFGMLPREYVENGEL